VLNSTYSIRLAQRATPPCRGGDKNSAERSGDSDDRNTYDSWLDPELTGYRYPRAVQFYEFQDQAQTLRMTYMCAESESSNQKSVLLLHGKNFSGAYGEPTIRELLREGYEFPLVATRTLLIIGQRDRTAFAGGASETCARHSATTPYWAELPHEPSTRQAGGDRRRRPPATDRSVRPILPGAARVCNLGGGLSDDRQVRSRHRPRHHEHALHSLR
jgi:hypothetical protein